MAYTQVGILLIKAGANDVARQCCHAQVAKLMPESAAVEIARIPEEIRGYGHVKERHLKAARPKWDGLMAQWRAGAPVQRQVA